MGISACDINDTKRDSDMTQSINLSISQSPWGCKYAWYDGIRDRQSLGFGHMMPDNVGQMWLSHRICWSLSCSETWGDIISPACCGGCSVFPSDNLLDIFLLLTNHEAFSPGCHRRKFGGISTVARWRRSHIHFSTTHYTGSHSSMLKTQGCQ